MLTSDLTPTFSIADVTAGDSIYTIVSSGSESDTTGTGFSTNDTIQITISNLASDNVSEDDGVFSFTAFAVDSAGNASASVSSALSVTIDTTAPSAPIITLRAGDDSGVLNDDQLTNVMNPQFNIWNADGEDSLYIAAGSDTVFRGVPDENPDIVSTDSTTEGTISYTALLRDKAGNLSSVSTAYPVVIDTTRPGTPSLPNLLSASDAGFDDEDNITNVTLPNFVLTGLTPSTIDSALIYFDGSVAGSQWISQPLIDTLQIDPQSFNPVEIIGVSVGAIDSAGNVSLISDTLIIKIDTDPPTTSDPDLIPSSDLGESSTDDVTSDNTPTILFSTLEPGSINKLYRIAPGPPADTVLVQVDTVAAGEDTLSLTPSSPLPDDTYTVYSTTEDTAGNVVESGDLLNLVIDTQEPSAVISLEDSLVRLEDLSDTVRVNFSEGMSNPPQISVRYAGGAVQDTSDMTAEFDSVWFFLLDIPDSNDGTATISITATDNASNELDSLNIVGRTLLKIDNTDPIFSSITPDTGSFVNYTEVAYTITEHANNPNRLDSATFTWTPTGPGSIIQADLETFELDVGIHSLGTLAADPQLEDGVLYTLSITSQDSAGNEGTTIVGNVTYDTTSLSALLMYSSYLTRADSTVTITATFSEQTGGIPSLLIEYNSGAGDSDSGNMTDQSGDSTVWFYDALIPSGVVNNDTALVTITTTDRALNSLTTDSTFFRDTLLVDNSTASVLSMTTSDSLVKELDVDTVTVVFDEPMRPFPMLEVLWAGGDTLESSQMTEVNGTDSTEWIFVISSVPDSNDGFATVVINAFDDAGNPITSSSLDIIEVDNIHTTFTSVSPDSDSFVNHKNIAYTLSEELESGTVTWQWTNGVMDPVTHIDTLIGAELLPGVHESFEPANAPDLTDGSVYRVTFDGFDFALNAAVQTISGSVMYDTTGPTVDSLVYSKNPAMPGDTVEVKAYFNEIIPTAPSFITAWPGLGGGGPFSLDSTLDGGMLVWLMEVEVPGISVSGNVVVTPTALDRAINSIDSLGGMVTDLFDTTWYIDVDAPTCSLTYVNVNQPFLTNLGKGGDEVQITATFNEKAKGFSDAVPRLTIIFTDTSDHSIEGTPFTSSSNGDTTWTYSFDLPSDSSYTGFLTVRLAAYDLAGNLVEDVVDTNVFEIDNIPPSLFTTGTVTPMGTLPKASWFNQRTDSVAVLIPIDSDDPSLFQGKVQIRMQIDGVPSSETDVGMPELLTNISSDKTVDLMRDTVSTAFDPADFMEGVSLISWAELYDLAGNVTEGSTSTDTLVVDTIPPIMGTWVTGIVVSADTVISSDSLSAVWTGFSENEAAGESGINYYDWAVGRLGSSDFDSTMAWTSVTDTSADSLVALRHLEIYNISLRAVDNAGNRSDTLETDAPGILRLNSAPELVVVDSQLVDEDVQFTYQIIGTDIDTTTLFGDTLHYTLIDTAGILIPDTSFPLLIGEYTGLIDWNTPLQADTGTYNFNVRVADEWGFSDTTSIVLTIGSVNDTPQVSLIPNVTFVEDVINGDTLSLHQYVTDVDNDTTEIIWVAVVMPDSTDYPNYPEFFFGPGTTPELERIIRNWILKERVKKEFTIFGKNGSFAQPAGDTTLAVIIDTLNSSTFAYFVADSNYYVDGREVIFVATDPDGAADSTNIAVTITALNDPPVMAVMLDTSMNENDTLILPLSAIDIDDSTVTFQVLSDTSAMTVSLNDTFATFIPDQFWVDSTDIIVIVSDEEYSDSTQFNLRVWRVPRPKLALSLGQNATFTRYFEFIMTDTAEKALDVSLTIQQTGEQVTLDTVGNFTWIGHYSFDTTKTYDFVMYGNAKVGDTTITRSAELALARANAGWIASSSDGYFQVVSGAGAVAYDQPFIIVDSLLFPVNEKSGGLYRMGHPLLSFAEPVMITLFGDTTLAEEDQALYIKSEEEVWQELPTISKNGILMSWTSKMGYFKIGRKTIFIPEFTSIQQNYPNPFNAQTHIIYDIGFFGGPDQKMNFIIYNLLGQEVYRIAKGNVEIGRHEFIWNGTDNFGVPVSSGIYITRLTTNSGFSASKKMMLMK